ncbi:MAG TPA: glycosyltransferase, partial [Flavitalea sp.]|nr:glycosyltransferase [Flavitalea sp.]
VKAVIVGSGPEKARLQNKIELSGLQSNIKMTGQLPYAYVLDHMERAKVFLHPSSYEGFSGVCLEAVSLGAHVISFCKPMNTEIRNWIVVNNPEQMLNKSLAILLNPHMEFTPQVEYHIDETAKKIVSLFV